MVRLLALCLSLLLAAAPARAQEAVKLSPQMVAEVVNDTNAHIKEHYLYPDKVGQITGKLSRSLASGRYAVSDPADLAKLLTQDMQAVTSDGHMGVKFSPVQAKALAAPKTKQQPPSQALQRQMLMANNFGINELKVLPGNVRYANIGTFGWDPELSPAAFDLAIRFLRGGAAYILDIRTNGGGDSDAVAYLVSHFMDADKRLMNFYSAGGNQESRTLKTLAAGRLETRPLYLLTSKGSFSAAEEFAAHVKNFKLGTIVGETTGGGGNNNVLLPTPHGFVVSVSMGQAIHAATGKSWEGEGIVADVLVPGPKALDAAHMEALKTLKAAATPQDQKKFNWIIETLEAKLRPTQIPAADQQHYTGRYGEQRSVVARDGKLFWKFGPGEWELLPMGSERFGLVSGPPLRLKFDRDGAKVISVTEIFQSGKTDTFTRID